MKILCIESENLFSIKIPYFAYSIYLLMNCPQIIMSFLSFKICRNWHATTLCFIFLCSDVWIIGKSLDCINCIQNLYIWLTSHPKQVGVKPKILYFYIVHQSYKCGSLSRAPGPYVISQGWLSMECWLFIKFLRIFCMFIFFLISQTQRQLEHSKTASRTELWKTTGLERIKTFELDSITEKYQ